MATLTIIKDDNWVGRDGVGFNIDCSSLAANIHAIQWDGSKGWIEYNDGTDNNSISSISAYSAMTDEHATKKAAAETRAAEDAAEQAAYEKTHAYKRLNDDTTKYASIEDQLDQQYWDAVNGTTTWKDGIAAVKAAHPKS